MALPADFSKIYGSTATGGLTPISDVNYAKGWEFVGGNPPTKNDFSYLQNLSDLKSQWLYSNKLQRTDPFGDIKSDGSEALSTALANLGLVDVVRDTRTINGKRLNADITLTAAELGIGQATEGVAGIVQISDAIANDSRVAASSAAVYKLLPKREYTANDFIRIPDTPGGLMLQWGRLPSGEGVNFPTPFTNNCLWCVVTPQSPSSGPFDMVYLYTRSFDRFGFLRSAATTATPCYWLAIGY